MNDADARLIRYYLARRGTKRELAHIEVLLDVLREYLDRLYDIIAEQDDVIDALLEERKNQPSAEPPSPARTNP